MSLNAGMFSSEYDGWCTEGEVLQRVRRIDEIGLDPFGNAQSIVGARVEWRLVRGQDALRLDWRGFGLTYANPPFGEDIGPCAARMAHFGALGVEIVGLVPHRTDTAWYRQCVRGVSAKCEWEGRMRFIRGVDDKLQMSLFGEPPPLPAIKGETSAPFPTALLYYGERVDLFVAAFEDAGEIWKR